jgi:hypothetical protein
MSRRHARRAAALAICLCWLPLAAAAAPIRPIEGHENWKLGMTLAEALAAEPRAARHDCAEAACLHYADQRFASAEIAVSARFDDTDALDVIIVTMTVKPGDNRCKRLYGQLAAFYTSAHGETLPVSPETWIWSAPEASLTLLGNCAVGEGGVINILFEAVAGPAG